MGRGPCLFKETDVARAVKAARKAGIEVGRVEVDKSGKIIIIAAKPGESNGAASVEKNEWDEVLDNGKDQVAVR